MRGLREFGRRGAAPLRRVSFVVCASALASPAAAVAAGDPVSTFPPAPPVIVGPSSPSNVALPLVSGTGEPGSVVNVYSSGDCSGDPLATAGPVAPSGDWSVPVPVPADAETTLHASASWVDDLGTATATSACSAEPFVYTHDGTPPPGPVLRTSPPSPSVIDSPTLFADAAEPSSTVRVYTQSGCAGEPVVAAPADELASQGAVLALDQGVTSLYATATDAAGNSSPCPAEPFTYMRMAADPPALPPLVPAPSQPAPVQPDPAPPDRPVAGGVPRSRTVRLSDERTLSRWAHPRGRFVVRRAPRGTARGITRLERYTEDGVPEIYLALRSRVGGNGQAWVQIRLPRRPNGSVGWVRRSALGGFHVVRTRLVIDKRHLRATLYRRGHAVWRARVGVGKRGTPTPSGHFWVREKLRPLERDTIYGPLAFGTSAYSVLSDWPGGGVVGIHGTNEPRLIPGRPSHGCVRVRNRAILRLGRLMPLGTPVRIR